MTATAATSRRGGLAAFEIFTRLADVVGLTVARFAAVVGHAPAELTEDDAPPAVTRVEGAPAGAPYEPGWLRRHLFSVTVIATYATLGIVAYGPLLSDGSGRLVAQRFGDPAQMVWFFGWTAHALATAHNPFYSPAANAPYGVNLAQLTSAPLLAVLFAPLTLLAGPVSSVTVCFVLAMPLSAASAYAVLRRWRVWAPAAALGGLAYGFSPSMINEGSQHLNLVFLALPPLIVAALVELCKRPRHPVRWGVALGVLATAQYFVSSEILALTAVASVVGLLITGAYWAERNPSRVRAALGPATKGAAAAVVVALFLLAYPIWFGFAGPHHYVGRTWAESLTFNAHLSDFVAPTPLQLFRPVLGATGATAYAKSSLLEGAYLGWGVLAVVAVLLWLCRGSLRVRLAAAVGACSAVLAFGSHGDVSGKGVPLPFLLLSKVPTLGDIIPVRFTVVTTACVAALLAFALDSLHRDAVQGRESACGSRTGARRAGAAFAAVALVVVVTWLPAWPFRSEPVQTLPAVVTKALPAGDPLVLTYPYPLAADDGAMLWQAAAGFPFRLSGVYAMVPQPQRGGQPDDQSPPLRPYVVQEYLASEDVGSISNYPKVSRHRDVVAAARAYVVRQHVGAVLVSLSAPNATNVAKMFTAALGPPRLTSGNFELWVTDH